MAMKPMFPYVRPGDIFMTSGSSLLARMILWGQREKGEEPSLVSHVGMFTTHAPLDKAMGVEALWSVEHHKIWPRYRNKDEHMIVMRPLNLNPSERHAVVNRALSYVGARYGWWKLLFHLGHKLTGKDWFLDLSFIERFPICSFLVADAFQSVGFDFGVPDDEAQPDDIFDFTTSRRDKYACVMPLTNMKEY